MPLIFVTCSSTLGIILSTSYAIVGSLGLYEAVQCVLKEVLDK